MVNVPYSPPRQDKQVIELKHDIEQHPNEAIDERETIGARQRELEAAERTRELVLAQMREKETRLAKLRNERVQPPPPVIVQQPAIDRASKPTTAFLTPVGDWDGPADDAVVRSFQAVPGGEVSVLSLLLCWIGHYKTVCTKPFRCLHIAHVRSIIHCCELIIQNQYVSCAYNVLSHTVRYYRNLIVSLCDYYTLQLYILKPRICSAVDATSRASRATS